MPNRNAVGHSPYVKWRYIFVVAAFFGTVNLYILRANMSVAMVAMVNQTFVTSRDNNTADTYCVDFIEANKSDHVAYTKGDFDWEPRLQGLILGSFYYGYCLTQLLGGLLVKKISASYVFGAGVLIPSLLAVLTPTAANMGPYWLIGLRVLQGLAEGVTIPSLSTLIVKWMPPLELTRAMGTIASGFNIGTVVAMVCSGLICASPLGWPAVFYLSGASGVVWFLFWMLLVRDSPAHHPFISDAEKRYIKTAQCTSITNKSQAIPWREILFSRAVLPYYFAEVTSPFIFYTGLASYPTYMEEVLHFNIDQNGMLSALPYVCGALSILATSFFVDDVLRKRRIMTTTGARKFVQVIGQTLCVGALLGVPLAGCHRMLAVVLLILSSVGGAITSAGYAVSPCDMAPNHVGIIFGIGNTLASIPAMFGPYITGALTNNAFLPMRKENVAILSEMWGLGSSHNQTGNGAVFSFHPVPKQTISQWFKVFAISSGLCYSGTVVFCLFGTCRLQWWNDSSNVVRSIQEDLGGSSGEEDRRPLMAPDDIDE